MIRTSALDPHPGLHSRRRARLLVELRDQFHLAVIALLRPLRCLSQAALAVRLERLHEREARLLELRRILQARLARMRPATRPHYSPSDRAEILTDKHHLRLSDRTAASIYGVVRQTVCSWNIDVDRTERSRLVRPVPAVADHQDAIRRASDVLPAAPEGHKARIAAILAQLTSTAPARRRAREQRSDKKAHLGVKKAREVRQRRRSIQSRRPNHYWTVDLTELRSLFGIHGPYLAVVLDLYSRYPVAWQLWPRRPSSAEVARLLERASRTREGSSSASPSSVP
jgi:hypothetical protein